MPGTLDAEMKKMTCLFQTNLKEKFLIRILGCLTIA